MLLLDIATWSLDLIGTALIIGFGIHSARHVRIRDFFLRPAQTNRRAARYQEALFVAYGMIGLAAVLQMFSPASITFSRDLNAVTAGLMVCFMRLSQLRRATLLERARNAKVQLYKWPLNPLN